MIWHYPVLGLILVSVLTTALGNDTEESDFKLEFANLVKSRCERRLEKRVFSDLEQALGNLNDCISRDVRPPTDLSQMPDFICNEMPRRVRGCIGNVMNKALPCMDVEEKYLPDFILGSFNISVEEQCKNGGQAISEIMQAAQQTTATCKEGAEMQPTLIITECAETVMTTLAAAKNAILRKDDLCSAVAKVQECAIRTAEDHCQDSSVFGMIKVTLSPYIKWCMGH